MKGRHAHAGFPRQLLDVQHVGKVCVNSSNGLDHLAELASIHQRRTHRAACSPVSTRRKLFLFGIKAAKAAQALLRIANAEDVPVRLLLGSDALGLVREKLADMSKELQAWEAVTRSTDGQ